MVCRNESVETTPNRIIIKALSPASFTLKDLKNGLIFIHSENGLSHDGEEYSYPDDIRRGMDFLKTTLMELASKQA